MKRLFWLPSVLVIFTVISALISCEGMLGHDAGGNGTLSVLLTDDPFPIDLVAEASVRIDSVVIREKVESDEGSPFHTLVDDSSWYNLLNLRNGVTESLVEMEIPAGEYDLVRLMVGDAKIVLNDGSEPPLTVPSGEQTGIKIFIEPDLTVEGGLTAELLLDFNLDKSFIAQGNLDSPAGVEGFNFKPVIRAVNNSEAGQVDGSVADGGADTGIENANVLAIQNDDTLGTALADADGYYLIPGLLEGSYTITAFAAGYDTVSADVDVVAANKTTQDFELTAK